MRSRTQSKEYLLVGVTGGIGSGKSAVCDVFRRRGRVVLSADDIARRLTEEDEQVRRMIGKEFGDDIYPNGRALDRKRLASIVFTSPPLRRKLDRIVHPRVFEEIDAAIQALSPDQRKPYVIVEAALIYESGMDRRLDRVIVVDAEEESRIARVMRRDGRSREDVLHRLHSQMSAAAKVEKADFVIRNDSDPEGLTSRVSFLDKLLTAMIHPTEAGVSNPPHSAG